MADNSQTILYKDYQIDITPASMPSGKWKVIWRIWISDEATLFVGDKEMNSETEASSYGEKEAKEYIDKNISV